MHNSMKLVYQNMAIFFNIPPTSNHLHLLQVENCDSNSRFVVDEDDNGKFRLENVKPEVQVLGDDFSRIYIHHGRRNLRHQMVHSRIYFIPNMV